MSANAYLTKIVMPGCIARAFPASHGGSPFTAVNRTLSGVFKLKKLGSVGKLK